MKNEPIEVTERDVEEAYKRFIRQRLKELRQQIKTNGTRT